MVNYGQNDGFVIVSAVKNTEPILAYSDCGSFNLDAIKGSPIEEWLEDSKFYVGYSSLLPDSIKLSNAQQWDVLTNLMKPINSTNSRAWGDDEDMSVVHQALNEYSRQGYSIKECPRSDVHTYSPNLNQALDRLSDQRGGDGYTQREKSFLLSMTKSTYDNKPAMLTTAWDQGHPYNGKLRETTDKTEALGCITIAVAQLMKYYGKPTGEFQYDEMPNKLYSRFDKGYDILSDFLYHVGKNWLEIEYEKGKSNCNISKAVDVLKAHGFPNAKKIDYDFFSIKPYLKEGPIYLSAIPSDSIYGHAWVCDGYLYITTETSYKLITFNGQINDISPTSCFNTIYTERNSSASNKLHMNWGWDGTGDGLYLQDNWSGVFDGEPLNFSKESNCWIKIA